MNFLYRLELYDFISVAILPDIHQITTADCILPQRIMLLLQIMCGERSSKVVCDDAGEPERWSPHGEQAERRA